MSLVLLMQPAKHIKIMDLIINHLAPVYVVGTEVMNAWMLRGKADFSRELRQNKFHGMN